MLLPVVALSLHSVFEGLAIGLQPSQAQLVSLFLAVLAHKAVMGFSLGLTTARSPMSHTALVISNTVFRKPMTSSVVAKSIEIL